MKSDERGSLFLEALIAAAIIAMVLAGAYQAVGAAAARQHQLEARRAAYLIAQSQLASVGGDLAVQPGSAGGVDGDYVWRIDITPYRDALAQSAAGELYQVRVGVRPRGAGADLAVLTSLRLARS